MNTWGRKVGGKKGKEKKGGTAGWGTSCGYSAECGLLYALQNLTKLASQAGPGYGDSLTCPTVPVVFVSGVVSQPKPLGTRSATPTHSMPTHRTRQAAPNDVSGAGRSSRIRSFLTPKPTHPQAVDMVASRPRNFSQSSLVGEASSRKLPISTCPVHVCRQSGSICRQS